MTPFVRYYYCIIVLQVSSDNLSKHQNSDPKFFGRERMNTAMVGGLSVGGSNALITSFTIQVRALITAIRYFFITTHFNNSTCSKSTKEIVTKAFVKVKRKWFKTNPAKITLNSLSWFIRIRKLEHK